MVCTTNFAGVERHVAVLASAQHDQGHQVTVLGGDLGQMREAIDRPGVELSPAPDMWAALRGLTGPAGRRADVVATHMTTADVAALISPALVRTPVVSTRHFAARRGATPGTRSVAERLQSRLSAEIAVSEHIATSIDVDATVILPGIPDRPDGSDPSSRSRTVLVAQRLEAEKSTDVAVAAFAASGLDRQGWRLSIAGDGSQRAALEGLAERLQVRGSVDFLGHRSDVDHLMAQASLFLAPCTIEGMGLAVVEAMAAAVPVVAAAAGGHLESVGGARDPVLFAPGDAQEAGHLMASLAADPERRDRYGRELQERQRRDFSVAAQATATEALYRHVIAASSPRPTMGTGRELVVVSLEPWDRVWRRNQHLLAGLLLAEPSLRVLVVEPAQDPVHRLRSGSAPRVGRGLRRGPHLSGVGIDNLWLLEPTKALPRRLDPDQDERWAAQVEQAATRLGFTHPMLWANDPHGALVLERTGWPTLYDITDDWLEADRDAVTLTRLATHEATLMERAAEVVVCSPSLVTTKSRHRPVTLIHNAVDAAATARPTARPSDLPAGPVAVYIGTLHSDRLDIRLCEQTAESLGDRGTLVLVGPDALTDRERERLDEAGIVRLGPKDRRLVPAYLQHADVLVVPHVVDDFTDSLDPIKLYEYRAVGRPVVSTPVAGFREAADDRLRVVASRDFPAAVTTALPAADRYPTGVDTSVPTWADRVQEMREVLQRVEVGPDPADPEDRAVFSGAEVPLDARVRFGHAAVQQVAERAGVDLLHIKGVALDDSLIHPDRHPTDADVLVRPDHIEQLVAACTAVGYRATGRFSTSSPFEHAMTLWHDLWGYLDIHRHFPGIGLPPDEAFERLWSARTHKDIAAVPCATPALIAQIGIVVLHSGRTSSIGRAARDVRHVWHLADEPTREAVRGWVAQMHAEVGFAAGLGMLDSLPPSPEQALWSAVARDGRIDEWRARIAVAPDRRSRLVLTLRAFMVNTDHLATQLGHRPTRAETLLAFVDRIRRGALEILGRGGDR